jgi:hypothetical protein
VKVTLHVPEGDSISGLRRSLTDLDPRASLRGVSGRAGVLVEEDLALRFLAERRGLLLVAPGSLPEPPEEPTPTDAPPVASVNPETAPEAPAAAAQKKPPVKKAAAKKATSSTAKEG